MRNVIIMGTLQLSAATLGLLPLTSMSVVTMAICQSLYSLQQRSLAKPHCWPRDQWFLAASQYLHPSLEQGGISILLRGLYVMKSKRDILCMQTYTANVQELKHAWRKGFKMISKLFCLLGLHSMLIQGKWLLSDYFLTYFYLTAIKHVSLKRNHGKLELTGRECWNIPVQTLSFIKGRVYASLFLARIRHLLRV